jgi:hypothetical protein
MIINHLALLIHDKIHDKIDSLLKKNNLISNYSIRNDIG